MATNKNAQLRYLALDNCLSNTMRKFYINDLIEYCSKVLTDHYGEETRVSRRTIYDDLNFMESEAGFSAPIDRIKDGRKTYYRYEDSNFSIRNQELNQEERTQIAEALLTLSRVMNVQGFDWVSSALTKIDSSLELDNKDYQVINFQENEYLKGIEHLHSLYKYIISKQVLKISYRPFTEEQTKDLIISPYYLKQYNNRWFLFGKNHEEDYLQNMALDRIESFEAINEKWIPNETNMKDYFDDIIGVTNKLEEDLQNIRIQLSDDVIPYIKSKPLHPSQNLKGNILSLEVKLNYELESLILSHGEKMEVLEPKMLREKIIERVKAINDFYNAD